MRALIHVGIFTTCMGVNAICTTPYRVQPSGIASHRIAGMMLTLWATTSQLRNLLRYYVFSM